MVDASWAVEEQREALTADYPEWRVWLSRHGELWNATRIRDLPSDKGWKLDRTLVRDSAPQLAAALAAQRELERTATSS
jgi:hypothetical protein